MRGVRRTSVPPENAFWIPGKGARPLFKDSGGTVHSEASKAFYRILEMLFAKFDADRLTLHGRLEIRKIIPQFKYGYPHGAATIHLATEEQREAFNALFIAVAEAIELSHQAGIERGKSLLVHLAKGSLTTTEFNNAVIKGEDDNE